MPFKGLYRAPHALIPYEEPGPKWTWAKAGRSCEGTPWPDSHRLGTWEHDSAMTMTTSLIWLYITGIEPLLSGQEVLEWRVWGFGGSGCSRLG